MVLEEVATWIQQFVKILQNNLLLIAVLATFFFYGDEVYRYLERFAKQKTHDKVSSFVFLLVLVLILAAIPAILQDIITKYFSMTVIWLIIAILISLCGWKYFN